MIRAAGTREVLIVGGRDVAISNPHEVPFPQAGHTTRDVARDDITVGPGARRAAGHRPDVLVRPSERLSEERDRKR